VVTDYLAKRRAAGATSTQLGFNLVGYGCTTCIGNSGPLAEPISQGDQRRTTSWPLPCSRATATSKAASRPTCARTTSPRPPLVVAYALGHGSMELDLIDRPDRARHATARPST